jgi:hypothetical protein
MLQKLEAAVASCEAENGDVKGYALITFHDGFYNVTCAAFEDDDGSMEVIADVVELLGYEDQPMRVQ